MMHRNAQTLGDAIREFFEDNAELRGKILEIRVMRAWGEILGPMVAQYTRNIYVKDKVLYVSLTSSVLRIGVVPGTSGEELERLCRFGSYTRYSYQIKELNHYGCKKDRRSSV